LTNQQSVNATLMSLSTSKPATESYGGDTYTRNKNADDYSAGFLRSKMDVAHVSVCAWEMTRLKVAS
jgi:hypothetical protein